MIERDDIKAAIAAGVLSEVQATRLIGLANGRQADRGAVSGNDEPFELFQGFNEIFIVTGMAILFLGWSAFTGISTFMTTQAGTMASVYALIGLVILFFATRYFSQQRRMVAPSIALSIFCGVMFVQLGLGLSSSLRLDLQERLLLISSVSMLGLGAYWWYFRIPFTLALVGIAGLAVLFAITLSSGAAIVDLQNVFLLTAEGPFGIVTILFGLVVLGVAMFFDLSDPHRVTRRAANGFWLHLIAAPAIVNTIALTLLEMGTTASHLILIAFLAGLALFAVVIDRRSFLMAGAGYAVALSVGVLGDESPLIILVLGAALVFLGAKWQAIRGRTLAALPAFPGKDRLPPWTSPHESQS